MNRRPSNIWLLATVAVLAIVGFLVPVAQASAETFVVNTLEDRENFPNNCAGGSGTQCSLRDAISLANETSEASTIHFEEGLEGTLEVDEAPLPELLVPIAIDATASSAYDGEPLITLKALEVESEGVAAGLNIEESGGGSTIEGLRIEGFEDGIFVNGELGSSICADQLVGNEEAGILVRRESAANKIGSECTGAPNLISGNSEYGVLDEGEGTRIVGNLIGTDAEETGPLANETGIFVAEPASETYIGDEGTTAGNTIAYNEGAGVAIQSSDSEVSIRHNSIHDNGGKGIELMAGEPLNNVVPTITEFDVESTLAFFEGEIEGGRPSEGYEVDLYASPGCAVGGEGRTYLGEGFAFTDDEGRGTIFGDVTPPPPGEEVITATASGDVYTATSEFSACAEPTSRTIRVNSLQDTSEFPDSGCLSPPGLCTLPDAILSANASRGRDTITFEEAPVGPGEHQIELTEPLPAITESVRILGTESSEEPPIVQLNGTGIPAIESLGLVDKAGGSEIDGLAFIGFHIAVVLEKPTNPSAGSTGLCDNWIGPEVEGGTVPNQVGIEIAAEVQNAQIGAECRSGNTIAGNIEYGIVDRGERTQIERNSIGIGPGESALPNGIGGIGGGILIAAEARETWIGPEEGEGIEPESGNRIDFNDGPGVRVANGSSGASIRLENEIFENLGRGIVIEENAAVSPAPVLERVEREEEGGTRLEGTIPGAAEGQTFNLDFFANPACLAEGETQGKTYLDRAQVEVDADGHFSVEELEEPPAADPAVTVTSTPYLEGEGEEQTSEFSNCRSEGEPGAPQLTSTTPASPGNTVTPLLKGTAEAGTTITLYRDEDCSGAPYESGLTAAELEAGVLVTVPADAESSFSATATSEEDVASLCSEPLSYLEDSTPPTVSIETHPTNPSASTSAEFTFSGEDSGGSGVKEYRCSLNNAAFGECESPASYSGLADGTNLFEVEAIDKAGNVGGPAFYSWEVDTTPPVVTIASLSPEVIGVGGSAELKFHASENGTYSLRRGGTDCETGTVIRLPAAYTTSPAEVGLTISADDLEEGENTVRLCMVDEASNLGSAATEITLDTSKPTVQIDTHPANPTNATNAEFTFGGTDSGSGIKEYKCSLNDALFATCTSGVQYTELPNGPNEFEVESIDNAGNASTPARFEWTVDTSAPTVTIDSVSKTAIGAGGSSELKFHADKDGTYELRLGGSDCTTGTLLQSGTYASQPAEAPLTVSASELNEGANELRLCVSDALENTGATETAIRLDTVAPTATITSAPSNPSKSSAANFSFSGSDPGGSGIAGYECKLGSPVFSPCSSPQSYASLADGSYSFEVRAIDNAGNVGAPAVFAWTIDTSSPPPRTAAVNGETIAVTPEEGNVLIKVPGSDKYVPIQEYKTIPVGSIIDATHGKVLLTTVDANGHQQSAYFYGGIFKVTQRDGSGLVTLSLVGGGKAAHTCGGVTHGHGIPANPGHGSPCECPAESSASASKARGRHLWGSGHGNFRTEGSYGSATVRGTTWLTEERCDGTYFKVKEGLVSVRDFRKGKSFTLGAGKTYLAGP